MSEHDLELVITRMDVLTPGVVQLTFAQHDGSEMPPWEPGAHVDLRFASHGVDFVRQYSLCGPVSDRCHWKVAVLHALDGRGGSAHIHAAFAEGDTVRVTGPRNHFPLQPANRYLFIAGGIGITPIVPMLAQVAATDADWRLIYCGRSMQSMAFADDMRAYGEKKVTLHESDTAGLLNLEAVIDAADPETVVYCCGPESMLRALDACCVEWDSDRVHVERFARREDDVDHTGTAFDVEFARSGVVARVPADCSILEVAEALGVDIDSSCQEGTCGSCETKVLCGTPDHRDSVLSAKERAAGKTMMVCVSRSCTAKLVLDA
ncbi:ferredoxin [Caballeronia megalochromosomata]|jgi:ferredoxin-NADP reductase|nr:ferredoxin [Caballeronia megalochromosomata]